MQVGGLDANICVPRLNAARGAQCTVEKKCRPVFWHPSSSIESASHHFRSFMPSCCAAAAVCNVCILLLSRRDQTMQIRTNLIYSQSSSSSTRDHHTLLSRARSHETRTCVDFFPVHKPSHVANARARSNALRNRRSGQIFAPRRARRWRTAR